MIIALALLMAAALWFAYMAEYAEEGYQDQDGYHAGIAPRHHL